MRFNWSKINYKYFNCTIWSVSTYLYTSECIILNNTKNISIKKKRKNKNISITPKTASSFLLEILLSYSPSLSNHWLEFCHCDSFAWSRFVYKRNHIASTMCLTSFTQDNDIAVELCFCAYQYFFSFYWCETFYFTNTS